MYLAGRFDGWSDEFFTNSFLGDLVRRYPDLRDCFARPPVKSE